MKISIVSGSHRKEGQSLKVAKYIENTLKQEQLCDETWLLSLSENPIPLWDESIWAGDKDWQTLLSPLSEELASSDAFVIVSPEYHGQVPAGLKNFFLLWGKGELAHKPALIVTVSAGVGGSYPVAELRMSSYKNNRICYIPEHIIVRNVNTVLNANPEDNDRDADTYYRNRILFALKILREYGLSLRSVRESGLTYADEFKNGM